MHPPPCRNQTRSQSRALTGSGLQQAQKGAESQLSGVGLPLFQKRISVFRLGVSNLAQVTQERKRDAVGNVIFDLPVLFLPFFIRRLGSIDCALPLTPTEPSDLVACLHGADLNGSSA